MKIDELIKGTGFKLARGSKWVNLKGLSDDSRKVEPGYGFVARGCGDGAKRFIADAIGRGAVAVFTEDDDPGIPEDVAVCLHSPVDQRAAGELAERFYGEPGTRLDLIGVTGTNGKSTIAILAQHLLSCAGVQTGVIGTIHTDDGTQGGRRVAHLTTPGAIEFAQELSRMAGAGCRAVVAEVSSHALEQQRVSAYRFRAAVFTNLTQDHLDYHHTMQAYAEAKSILFSQLDEQGAAVVNRDDEYGPVVLGNYPGRVYWTTTRQDTAAPRSSGDTLCHADTLKLTATSSVARFDGPWGSVEATLPLIGEHNICNTLQAIVVANTIVDISSDLKQALESLPQVPGRLERVVPSASYPGPLPSVLVDYAHTPDALVNALRSLRGVTENRLIVMFGCGGDRDKDKRPKMAKAASDLADVVYLTSDNPRSEDPQAIINDALPGIDPEKKSTTVINADRAEAIRACILASRPGDTVLLAGKGHEDYQTIGNENIHFDDREHAMDALDQWVRAKAGAP